MQYFFSVPHYWWFLMIKGVLRVCLRGVGSTRPDRSVYNKPSHR